MSGATAVPPSLTLDRVRVGDPLPGRELETTASFVITTALASRDREPVHHDRGAAQASGLRDVFLNILTTNGLCVQLVTDWAGPEAVVLGTDVRLGVPHVAGDVLRLSGEVAAVTERDDDGVVEVAVRGTNDTGDHATGTVTVSIPKGSA